MNLKTYAITDIGLKRKVNQDSFLRDDELGLYVVADGMGGHRAGEVASQLAVE
ncbi:MAG: protein phosphatase 2C domain-containing protein, partial [Deltaproteobacteria bacterium]|nr:protein phosphatase 2C domain-containing protein [Deltaproteobacteria bacterium]